MNFKAGSSAALTLLCATMPAHAQDADTSYVSAMNYVSLDGQLDNADSSQASLTGSMALGNYTWLQGTLGTLTDGADSGLGDLSDYGVGFGVSGEHLQFSLNADQFKNDAAYTQRDVNVSLSWIDTQFSAGLDAFHRKSEDSASTTDTYNTLTVNTMAEQTLTGTGIGAHGSVNLTDQFSVSFGGMSYHYSQHTSLTSNVDSSEYPLLAQYLENRRNALLANLAQRINRLSVGQVTRSITPLDNTYRIGASYWFDAASLSMQYLHDTLLDSSSHTDTLNLSTSFFIGDHWLLAPSVGVANNSDIGSTHFGGLSLSYNW